MRAMRVGRRLLHALVIVLTLVIGATAAAVIVSQTAWFKNWLRGYIVSQANLYLNGQLQIQRLGGNLFFGVELENVAVSMDGSPVVAVKDLGVDYNVFDFITKGLSLDEISINQPTIYLRREGDTWSIARLVKQQEQEADREGPQYSVSIDKIGINDAAIVVQNEPRAVGTAGSAPAQASVDIPDRIEQLDAELSFRYEPVHYSLEISHLSFRGVEPSIGLNALSGAIAVRDDTVFVEKLAVRTEESTLSIDGAVQNYLAKPVFNLQVSSDKLSLPEIARIVPSLAGIALQPAFEIKASGPLDQLAVEMNLRSSAGDVNGRFVADVQAPGQTVKGDLSVRHLDLAPLLKDPAQKSDITASARVDLAAEEFAKFDTLRGTATVDAPRIAAAGYAADRVHADAKIDGRRVSFNGRAGAYGADATATGAVTLPEPNGRLAYDIRGRIRNVDLRRVPANLNVPAAETHVTADYAVRGTAGGSAALDIEGEARFAPSTVAGARIESGSEVAFSMHGGDVQYSAHATVSDLDLQRVGREFNVPALADDRYKSVVNAHISAQGRGTKPAEMTAEAHGTITNTTLFAGRVPELSFDASVANDNVAVKARGQFADFNPAVASGRADLQGSVAGSVDVDATIQGLSAGVTPDNIAGTARMTLEPSTVGQLAIKQANLDADYRERTGAIRQLEIVGRDLNVKAQGTVALNDTGASNLTFHADTANLEEIGKIINQPLAGIVKVDGKLTGNRSELQATGTIGGSGVRHGENGALSINGSYSARVPELTPSRAAVESDLAATFVTAGGMNINELAAKTTYQNDQLAFDVTARQPQRTLSAAGNVRLHTGHQEVHLDGLQLETAGQQWRLADADNPRIQYGGESVRVENVRLVNGAQEIAADGAFGRPGDALKVQLTNVDLATVDALMLRPPQLSGQLNGSATVAGRASSPNVEGTFAVASGGFREFKYDSLTATVNYASNAVKLDARLQQNPAQWISAKGTLPTALFSRPTGPEGDARGNDPIDLTVDSSPIDLGLIQGFTDVLTEVTGTVEAHLRVTGTADDPIPAGEVTIQNGAMMVEPVNVRYTNIAGSVQLQKDRVHIPLITVLDNHFNALTLTGDLSMRQRQVGGVNVYITAEDFKLLDNQLGEVRIQSAMELTGELRAPVVQGYLGVTSGNINLDRIIALRGPSAYATSQIEFETEAAASDQPQTAPSTFNALKLDVQLTVPDAFVVKASSLEPPGSSMSLGALNVTLGGDLRAMKDPGGQVRLVGAVNTVRGNYDFQGRRFEILRDGTVRFAGLEELNPILDLRTRRIIQGVEARVNVRGTLRQPEILLSSTPPLEEADILALIVFNQPVNQLGEGEQISLAARAQALATGAVAGQIAQSIGRALQLDTFEIDLAPESGGGPEVTLGQQIGSNLYLKVQQGVGEQTTTNFVLEYELTEWLRLQTNFLQGSSTQNSLFRRAQGSGGDLIFFFSY